MPGMRSLSSRCLRCIEPRHLFDREQNFAYASSPSFQSQAVLARRDAGAWTEFSHQVFGVTCHEAYLSTEQSEACTYPRVSRPHGDPFWSQDHQCPSSQGSCPLGTLNYGTSDMLTVKAGDGKSPRDFSRGRRLRHAVDFRHVFADPDRSSDRCFTVLARPAHGTQSHSRLGLAISRRQLRRAVDRNRIKRLIREYFRLHVATEQQGPALNFVVMARAAVRETDTRTLRRLLAAHFARLQGRLRPK